MSFLSVLYRFFSTYKSRSLHRSLARHLMAVVMAELQYVVHSEPAQSLDVIKRVSLPVFKPTTEMKQFFTSLASEASLNLSQSGLNADFNVVVVVVVVKFYRQ